MRLAFAVVIAALAALAPLHAAPLEKLVSVSGEATIAVAPDSAIIRVGVSSVGKSAREASEANARQMTAVLAAIRQSGVEDRDVQTSQLSLQPQYDPNRAGTARLTGFLAGNQVSIKVRDIGKLAPVLDSAIAAGANEMSGIEFVVSEQSRMLDRARGEAIADARRKAELYAQAAGAKLGPVVAITEEGAAPRPVPMMVARQGSAVPIAPGEQTLRVTVSVSYELAP